MLKYHSRIENQRGRAASLRIGAYMIKKLICLALILATALSLMACGGSYEPVPSTDEEARVVMTFSYEGEKYVQKSNWK